MATNENLKMPNKAHNNGEIEKFTQKTDESEASPLHEKKLVHDRNDLESGGDQSKGGIRKSFSRIVENIQESNRTRLLYILAASLCVILLLILILLVSFWPQVPFYLKAPVCIDKECLVASQQLLLWSNITNSPCNDSYNWACGKFKQEYDDSDFYPIGAGGEWNPEATYEYNSLRELNVFMSMLPKSGASDTVAIISGLYKTCKEIETIDKSVSIFLLKKAIKSIGGWPVLDETTLNYWDFEASLLHIQVLHGIFPFFKVSVENRLNKPFEYIIAIDEGDLGLPDKYFYNVDYDNKIVKEYQMLMKDFATEIGIVQQKAELFADEIYHMEKRIVKHIEGVKSSTNRKVSQILTLQEIKDLAPRLPVFEIVQKMFQTVKISTDTEILVRDPEVLQELSVLISTTDKKACNNFIVWSLVRNQLPYLSREFRVNWEKFQQSVYGHRTTAPQWLTCTKLVRDWLPFAIDSLQQNPELIKPSFGNSYINLYPNKRITSLNEKTLGNDELLRIMFHTVRNQVRDAIQNSDWINSDLKSYVSEKLTAMRLQIGIPNEKLDTKTYLNKFYDKLILQNMYFVEHLESMWSFRKHQMGIKMQPQELEEMLISEVYNNNEYKIITYSSRLNMILISKRLYQSNYFDYRFPISVNFARVGTALVKALLKIFPIFVEQYKEEESKIGDTNNNYGNLEIMQLDQRCISDYTIHSMLSDEVLNNIYISLSSTKISGRALSTFIRGVQEMEPIAGASIEPSFTYEKLGLTKQHRLPGLRFLNNNQLFTLATLQMHCYAAIDDSDYSILKPHLEHELAEKELFNIIWQQVPLLSMSVSCSSKTDKCTNIL